LYGKNWPRIVDESRHGKVVRDAAEPCAAADRPTAPLRVAVVRPLSFVVRLVFYT
jgi:hypothetical protein